MFRTDRRHINTGSDSEVLLNVLAHELEQASVKLRLDPAAIFTAVANVHRRVRGAYAVVAMIAGYGVLAFRDPFGIRPAGDRLQRDPGGHRVHGGLRVGRGGCPRLPRAARRGAGRGGVHRRGRQVRGAAVRAAAEPESLHLRVRLPGAARLADRRRLGVRDAAAHGREAGREDPPPAPRPADRRGDPDPGLEPALGAAARRRPRRAVPRGLRQEPLHRPHLHHARARRCARARCARS